MRPLELEPEERELLVGKVVRVLSAAKGGSFLAYVRVARGRELVVQRSTGREGLRSVSARFRGERVRVLLEEVEGVLDRRRGPGNQVVPLRAFLANGRA